MQESTQPQIGLLLFLTYRMQELNNIIYKHRQILGFSRISAAFVFSVSLFKGIIQAPIILNLTLKYISSIED